MTGFELGEVKEISSDMTSDVPVVNPEILGIAESKNFEGMNSFTEHFTDFLGSIVDNIKDFLGISTENLSEGADIYAEVVSNIMSDVFTKDVIESWPTMEFQERCELLNQYVEGLGQALGINLNGIIVEDLYATVGEGVQGYCNGDGYLHLDFRNIEDPSMWGTILETTTHEARHQLQIEAIDNPEKFKGVPTDMIEGWRKNMLPGNYESGEFDMEAYWNQPVEVDARKFAAEVISGYLTNLGF